MVETFIRFFVLAIISTMVSPNNSSGPKVSIEDITNSPVASDQETIQLEPKKDEPNKNENPAIDETQENKKKSRAISGLKPVDIYLNFENRGFKTRKGLTDSDSFWESTKSENGIDYSVYTFSDSGVDAVTSVKYNAVLNMVEEKNILAVMSFLQYGVTIPYAESDNDTATKWVKDNFNKDKETIEIGDAKFTIYAPTEFARSLYIEKK